MNKNSSLVQPYGMGRNRDHYHQATVLSNHTTAAQAFEALDRILRQLRRTASIGPRS